MGEADREGKRAAGPQVSPQTRSPLCRARFCDLAGDGVVPYRLSECFLNSAMLPSGGRVHIAVPSKVSQRRRITTCPGRPAPDAIMPLAFRDSLSVHMVVNMASAFAWCIASICPERSFIDSAEENSVIAQWLIARYCGSCAPSQVSMRRVSASGVSAATSTDVSR